jgi:hypothetical protein
MNGGLAMGRKVMPWEPDALDWMREQSPRYTLSQLVPLFNAEARHQGWHPRTKAAINNVRAYYFIGCTKRRWIVNLDTGEIYPSVKVAAAALYVSPASLYMALTKKRTCRGHQWAYCHNVEDAHAANL